MTCALTHRGGGRGREAAAAQALRRGGRAQVHGHAHPPPGRGHRGADLQARSLHPTCCQHPEHGDLALHLIFIIASLCLHMESRPRLLSRVMLNAQQFLQVAAAASMQRNAQACKPRRAGTKSGSQDSPNLAARRMHLRVRVDIHSLQGTVCAWVPPPPNDRLWFGFVSAPELRAEATPLLNQNVRARLGTPPPWPQ